MPNFPGQMLRGAILESGGGNVTDSGGVALTASATPHAKNTTYIDVITTTAFHAGYLIVTFANFSAAGDALVDIAMGAGGSEIVVAANLYCYNRAGQTPHSYTLPVNIPAGSRVSARFQCATASATMDITIVLGSVDLLSTGYGANPLTYGMNLGNSGGTDVDPGTTINTLGAYAQITASLTRDVNGLLLVLDNNADNARTACQWLVKLARGGLGSERILATVMAGCDGTADIVMPPTIYLPVYIPAGERLSAACQCTINTAGDRLLGVLVIAF